MQRLRVLTLNIWDRQGPWEQRLPLIREGVRSLDPDLVALQEVVCVQGRSQADDIREGLGYEAAFGVAHDYGGGVEFGNAVLSRWPIGRLWVAPLPQGGSDERRCVMLAAVASPYGTIPFFVTHLNWKLHEGCVREQQVVAIAEHIKREAPIEGFFPVLAGDFNAQPDATEIRFLKGLHALGGKSIYLADCFEQTGKGSGMTFDATRNPFAALTREHPRRIDYIFVRGPTATGSGKPLMSKVVLEEVHEQVAASDHYGVYAEISI